MTRLPKLLDLAALVSALEKNPFENSTMRALVLRLNRDGTLTEECNGPGASVWAMVSHRPRLKNGQPVPGRPVRALRLVQSVDKEHRLERGGRAVPMSPPGRACLPVRHTIGPCRAPT